MRGCLRVAAATVAAAFALVAGCGSLAASPAGADVARQAVDGLVQVHWVLGVDTGSMDGTYTTSSQLGQGTVHEGSSANFGGSIEFAFVRSDGMQMTGPASYDYSDFPAINYVVTLTGTSDVQSASLTLTQLSKTTDPDSPHPGYSTGIATFGVQGWLSLTESGSRSTATTLILAGGRSHAPARDPARHSRAP